MPVYLYSCVVCGEQEIKHSILDERVRECPICGTDQFKKLMVPTATHFKGSGFYSTDSK